MLYKIIKLISNEATNTTIFCYTTLALLSLDITKNTIWGPRDVSLSKNIALTLYLHLQTAIIVKCTIWKRLWLAFMYLLLDCFWDYFRNPNVVATSLVVCAGAGLAFPFYMAQVNILLCTSTFLWCFPFPVLLFGCWRMERKRKRNYVYMIKGY